MLREEELEQKIETYLQQHLVTKYPGQHAKEILALISSSCKQPSGFEKKIGSVWEDVSIDEAIQLLKLQYEYWNAAGGWMELPSGAHIRVEENK